MSATAAMDAVFTCEDVLIVDAVRSPLARCGPGGALANIRPSALLAQVSLALLDRTRLEPAAVTSAIIAGGPSFDAIARETCSLIGVAPRARRGPSEPDSSQQSIIHTAARGIGRHDVVLVLATTGPDLATAWPCSSRRGVSAELVAARWELSRADVDAYARQSRRRAREVAAMGEFGPEIIPVAAWSPHSRRIIEFDETIAGVLPSDGRPLFYEPAIAQRYPDIGWHLHAGNVGQPAVGAAAAIFVGHDRAIELGIRPRARLLALAECTHIHGSRLCGPIRAARAVLEHLGLDPDKLDHYEISEAFGSIPLAWQREFGADTYRLNPRGGSIGLGLPGPAAGLRSLATTLSALEATAGQLGIQASEGIGNAGDALLLEILPRPTLI
jgi:acetyl-CoA acetyltransferase